MKRLAASMVLFVLAGSLFTAGCSSSTPPPAPTQVPSASGKAAEPTKAVQAAAATVPTTAPAPVKKVDFPEKGRAITLILPYAPGGTTDPSYRILAEALKDILGVPVEVVNRPGASTQVGTTELVRSKPDGYTIGLITIPSTINTYVDPSVKAVYSAKDWQFIARYIAEPTIIGVRTDSPYQDLKALVDAAKASPGNVMIGTGGVKTGTGMAAVLFADVAGVQFNLVELGSTGEALTAVLGGHVDATSANGGSWMPHYKSKTVRLLGVMGKDESPFFPGVKTFDALGYKMEAGSTFGLAAPAGTPKEIVQVYSDAVGKAVQRNDVKERLAGAGLTLSYANADEFARQWAAEEPNVKRMLELAMKSAKQ